MFQRFISNSGLYFEILRELLLRDWFLFLVSFICVFVLSFSIITFFKLQIKLDFLRLINLKLDSYYHLPIFFIYWILNSNGNSGWQNFSDYGPAVWVAWFSLRLFKPFQMLESKFRDILNVTLLIFLGGLVQVVCTRGFYGGISTIYDDYPSFWNIVVFSRTLIDIFFWRIADYSLTILYMLPISLFLMALLKVLILFLEKLILFFGKKDFRK